MTGASSNKREQDISSRYWKFNLLFYHNNMLIITKIKKC